MATEKSWKSRIGSCFGVMSLEFATHPADQQRAVEIYQEACMDEGEQAAESFMTAAQEFLISQGALPEYIEEETESIQRFLNVASLEKSLKL